MLVSNVSFTAAIAINFGTYVTWCHWQTALIPHESLCDGNMLIGLLRKRRIFQPVALRPEVWLVEAERRDLAIRGDCCLFVYFASSRAAIIDVCVVRQYIADDRTIVVLRPVDDVNCGQRFADGVWPPYLGL